MDLCIMNPMFQVLKNEYKTTWVRPGSAKWYGIDYIFTTTQNTRGFAIIRVIWGIECCTGQIILRANFAVKGKIRANNNKKPQWIDVNMLQITSVHNATELHNLSRDRGWKSFKESAFGL